MDINLMLGPSVDLHERDRRLISKCATRLVSGAVALTCAYLSGSGTQELGCTSFDVTTSTGAHS